MADWLELGSKLPTFQLKSDQGKTFHSKQLLGSPSIVYFYPKDDTPGCTKEACAFREVHGKLAKQKATLIGISPDEVDSHAAFRDKYQLNFPLLADIDHQVAESFGAWREKNLYGKKSMGVQRSTFLFDAKGLLVHLWKRVSVDGHDQQVLDKLQQLLTEG